MNNNEHFESTDADPSLDARIEEALIMPDDKIEYPDNETWNNLGQVMLEKATKAERADKAKTPMPFPVKLVWWAAAAAAAVALMIDFWPQQAPVDIIVENPNPPSLQIEIDWAGDAGFPSVAEEDLAALEALEWQAELDVLILDLNTAGIIDTDDEEALNALLDGYGIDTGDLVASYIDQF